MLDPKTSYFELRHGAFDALVLIVKTVDIDALRQALKRRFEATPEFFANDSVMIDIRCLETDTPLPIDTLAAILRQMQMCPLGVIATDTQHSWVKQNHLPRVAWPDSSPVKSPRDQTPSDAQLLKKAKAEAEVEALPPPAQIIDKPLRSGQRVYAHGDLIVLKPVSHGAEIISEGHIHLYAPLRGRALAGVRGNRAARIFCASLEAELISIAGFYQTGETQLPAHLCGKPVQVSLFEEKLVIEALGRVLN